MRTNMVHFLKSGVIVACWSLKKQPKGGLCLQNDDYFVSL